MLGLSLFGGGYGPVHQAEDHRCDGGGADGGGLGRPGSRVKESGATKDPNLTRAASKRPGQTGDGRASLQGLASEAARLTPASFRLAVAYMQSGRHTDAILRLAGEG